MTATVTNLADRRTDQPPHVTDADTGQRYYIVDGEKFWSVSTATDIVNKQGLPRWAAGLAAAFAFDELPTIVTASRRKPCGRTYYKCKHEYRLPHIPGECPCRVCKDCVKKAMVERHNAEKSRRASEGTRTHDVIEWWALNDGQWRDYDDDIAAYVEAFRGFVDEYGLTPDSWEATEAIVINRAEKYAGTTDGLLRIDAGRTKAAAELVARCLTKSTGNAITADQAAEQHLSVLLVIDFKTQDKPAEKEKFYPDQALQLAGYRWAPVIRIKNTTVEEPLPDTDGALLVHLRPDGCTPRLTVADETTYAAFLCALNLFRWVNEFGTASISTRSFPLPKPPAKSGARTKNPAATTTPGRKRTTTPPAAAPAAATADAMRLTNNGRSLGNQLTDDDIPF